MDSHDKSQGGSTPDEQFRRDRAERAIARVHAIRTFNAAESGDLAFMAQSLVQLTLPHSDPGNVPFYERVNGDTSLIIQPGVQKREGIVEQAGIPYGVYPRLVLAWITTEAVRTSNRTLCLGGSLTAFMNELGLTATGGEKGTIPLLREQMSRLFRARITIDRHVEHGMDQTYLQVADRTKLWWDPVDPEEVVKVNSTIKLSDDFYHLITERPVPLDMRALQVLKTSPLGLDLYAWLTYRVSYMKHEAVIPWTALEAQLGSDYADTKNFTRKVKRELKRIKLVWPELEYRTPRGRLVLKPCPPHVRPKLKP